MSEAETIENGAEHITPMGTDEPITFAHTELGDVQGERISIDQSSVKSVSGKQVRINQSAVRKLDMQSGTVTQSAAATLSSTDLAMHESAAGYVNAGRVDLFDSTVGILHGPLTVSEGTARVLVHIGPTNSAIRPVLDRDSALRFGAAMGLSLVVFSRLFRRIFGR